jgi:hypothetical protein
VHSLYSSRNCVPPGRHRCPAASPVLTRRRWTKPSGLVRAFRLHFRGFVASTLPLLPPLSGLWLRGLCRFSRPAVRGSGELLLD